MTTLFIAYNTYFDVKEGGISKSSAITFVMLAFLGDLLTSGAAITLWKVL